MKLHNRVGLITMICGLYVLVVAVGHALNEGPYTLPVCQSLIVLAFLALGSLLLAAGGGDTDDDS